MERDQLEALRAAPDRGLGELADPARVPLAVPYAGLQPRPLGGLEHVVVELTQRDGDARPAREDAETVLGHAPIALLEERLPGARMRWHIHPGLCAVTTRLPGPFRAGDPAVTVQLGGRLPVVADGATAVGGVP